MKYPDNISGLIDISPDFIGFIFYHKSPRYLESPNSIILEKFPPKIQKVGVFVDEQIDIILKKVEMFQLDYVQLHGNESIEKVITLKRQGIKVIKVFRLSDYLPDNLEIYNGNLDFFMFDTATRMYGGSGRHFNWNLLENYHHKTPYLLSGGIGCEDIPKIKRMELKGLVGIDVNSRFEMEPGKKNLEMVKTLKDCL